MKLLNKSILPVLLIVLVALIIWRSAKHLNVPEIKDRLEYALQLAGKNRPELEKVLVHYKNDSLKHAAAIFLIENMDHCREEKWGCFRNGKPDSTFSLRRFKGQYDARKYMDSLDISYHTVQVVVDYKMLSSNFLTNHIDRAFKKWEANNYLSFEQFKEIFLPYRVGNEKIEDSEMYLSQKFDSTFHSLAYSDRMNAAIALNNRLKKEYEWNSRMLLYPASFTCQEFDVLKTGDCQQLADFGIKVFRAAGIAVGNDFVPAWGDNDAGHSWNVLFLQDKSIPFSTCGDNPGSLPFYYRAPKVFRRTFGKQDCGIGHYKSPKQEIPPELEDRYSIDVTNQYYKTIDVEVPLTKKHTAGDNCAFLCVYNRKRWCPVDWGKINEQKNIATFTNVTDSLLYCVMYYRNMSLTPATDPFLLSSANKIHYFSPGNKKETLSSIFDYNYYKGNTTEPNKEYELMMWQDGWKSVAKSFAYPCEWNGKEWIRQETMTLAKDKVKYFIDFDNVPANGLYWLTTDERPFWIENGKMTGRFPLKGRLVKELIQ